MKCLSKYHIKRTIYDDFSVCVFDNTSQGKDYSTVITHFDSSVMQDIDEYIYNTKEEAVQKHDELVETELYIREDALSEVTKITLDDETRIGLSCDIADYILMKYVVELDERILGEKSVIKDNPNGEGTLYTEKGQDIFNNIYDDIETIILAYSRRFA